MVPALLKGVLYPTTPGFLIILLLPAAFLFGRRPGGRAGKIWVIAVVLFYVICSTPLTVVPFVRTLSPSYPPVRTLTDARGATAIVVLGAGIDTLRSRGDVFTGPTRELALRMLEAAQVYRALGRPWVIVTGGVGNERYTQARYMATELARAGVDPDRIIEEPEAVNTRDHALLVPPILRARGVTQFVLVTSQQHIARALKTFRKVGWDPVPSTPQFFVGRPGLSRYLPSEAALEASSAMLYDEVALVYYWFRGWL